VIFARSRAPTEASFDLTAMIDIVLLLIIFFMLSSQFAQTTRSALDLPKEVGEQTGADSDAAIVIDLARDGGLAVLGQAMTLEQVAAAVASDVQRLAGEGGSAKLDLIVRAERTTPAVHLNRLALLLAQAGVRNWKLATAAEEAGSGAAPAGGGPVKGGGG
jgi:biopolymer transport protein ExbD